MSIREKRLCDMPGWREDVKCDDAAIDTCKTCDRDMCARHSMHEKGNGLVLKLESWQYSPGINTPGAPQNSSPWGSPSNNGGIPNGGDSFPAFSIAICRECREALSWRAKEVLQSLNAPLIEALRAKLSELALKKS